MSWQEYESARVAERPMQALVEHVKACHLAGLITPSESKAAQAGIRGSSGIPSAYSEAVLNAKPAAALNHIAKGARKRAETSRRLGRVSDASHALKSAEALESAALIKPEIGEHGPAGVEASIRAQLSTTGRHHQRRQMGAR